MNKCSICGTTESIVHSGVDALVLGCLDNLEAICYPCAKRAQSTEWLQGQIKAIYSKYHAREISPEQALDELELVLNDSEVLA